MPGGSERHAGDRPAFPLLYPPTPAMSLCPPSPLVDGSRGAPWVWEGSTVTGLHAVPVPQGRRIRCHLHVRGSGALSLGASSPRGGRELQETRPEACGPAEVQGQRAVRSLRRGRWMGRQHRAALLLGRPDELGLGSSSTRPSSAEGRPSRSLTGRSGPSTSQRHWHPLGQTSAPSPAAGRSHCSGHQMSQDPSQAGP